ncbi:MAG TPA: DUF3048 domain-containing protein [Roseiflexaceae bacterium]|nr:DUF3048 domain-containing protein [Roseiflexaceae bacterium]
MIPAKHSSIPILILLALLIQSCGSQAAPPQPQAALPTVAFSPTSAPTAAPNPTAALPTATAPPTATPQPIADPLTGAPAFARGQIKARPYIVMIDNHPDAYPQTGLDHAAVVFEALAEYGVTRFEAVFVPGISPDADKIGPVRSTRTYFVQWAMGMRALYAHAGGSPGGLALAQSTDKIINLDALANGDSGEPYFYRSKDRVAPHNLYTTSALLEKAMADQGVSDFSDPEMGFLFKEDAPADQRPDSQRIDYFFLYKQYPVAWTYDAKTNGYYRLWLGKPAIDAATGKQLWTRNILVMQVPEHPIEGDDHARIEQDVIGEGKAQVFMDGVEHDIVWRKEAPEAPLRFYDADGSEVKLNVGPAWIVALPALDHVTVK